MSNNEKLKHLMQENGIAVQDIASAIGVSKWTVRNWIRPQASSGWRKMPDVAFTALVMSIAVSDLMGSEKPTSDTDPLDLVSAQELLTH